MAFIVANYLKDKLNAEKFAEIDPVAFFDSSGVIVKSNIILAPSFPKGDFYHHRDLIIFIGEAQPPISQYRMANLILDVAQELGVKRIYTSAAAVVSKHVEEPKVWGAVTDEKLLPEVEKYGATLMGDFQIRGLNGLLLGVAKERNMEGICFLGEIPHYAAEFENPKAALAILKVLINALNLDIDLKELEARVKEMEEKLETLSKESMIEHLEHFTHPIWQRRNEEEKGE